MVQQVESGFTASGFGEVCGLSGAPGTQVRVQYMRARERARDPVADWAGVSITSVMLSDIWLALLVHRFPHRVRRGSRNS